MTHFKGMVDIRDRLPETNQEVTIYYQVGTDPTIYRTTLHWWDDIEKNYHVICWCSCAVEIY